MEGKPFKLRSGNKPAFKMMGAKSPANMGHKSPGKMKSPMELNKGFDSLPEGVQSKILKNDSPNKHIRSEEIRPGHNKKYHQTDPSNAAHDGTGGTKNYWKADESGKTPKQKEIESASTKSETTNTTTTSETKSETKTEPKKKKRYNILEELRKGHKKSKAKEADYKKNKRGGETQRQYEERKKREEKRAKSNDVAPTSSPNKLKTDSPAKKGHDKKDKDKRRGGMNPVLKEKEKFHENKGKGTPGDGGQKTYREGIKKSNPKYTDKVKELRNEIKEIERNIPDATVENNRRLRKLQNKVNKEMGSDVRHRKNLITRKYKKVVKK